MEDKIRQDLIKHYKKINERNVDWFIDKINKGLICECRKGHPMAKDGLLFMNAQVASEYRKLKT